MKFMTCEMADDLLMLQRRDFFYKLSVKTEQKIIKIQFSYTFSAQQMECCQDGHSDEH